MDQIINSYYRNDAKKLHNMVDRILFNLKFKDVDHEDFYSLANEVFAKDVLANYDNEQSFEGFLYSCLLKKFKTEMTRRTRDKRCLKVKKKVVDKNGIEKTEIKIIPDIRLDAPLKDGENLTYGDIVADKFDINKEIFEEKEESYSEKMLLYLNRLSEVQKEILRLTIAGYLPREIRDELHMTEKQYCDNYAAIHSYRNISVLF